MSLLGRQLPPLKVAGQQVRGMATEKQILMRINSTSNIAKITKSMKMVSAAKMRGAQTRLENGRPFALWLDNLGGKPRTVETDGLLPKDDGEKTNVMIPISSDRGLCGGVNSQIARTVRQQCEVWNGSDKHGIFVIGEKARSQLRRQFQNSFIGDASDCWSTEPSFAMASSIAQSVLSASEHKNPDQYTIFFQKFVSAIAYNPSIRTIDLNAEENSEEGESSSLSSYEFEPDNMDEVLADLREFQLASAIFHGMIENATSEESSRMAAMENATKNASELIDALTLQYNKARQARITTELIEIISGASSLDES